MEGNIYIKGNLYTDDTLEGKHLKENGVVIHVYKDFIYNSKDNIDLELDDVFIKNIFDTLDIKDIIAFSNKI